jgi:hypothetical protein
MVSSPVKPDDSDEAHSRGFKGAGRSLTFIEVSFVFGWGSGAVRVGMLEAFLLFKQAFS